MNADYEDFAEVSEEEARRLQADCDRFVTECAARVDDLNN
jgi:hypothetical protein